MGNIEVVQEGEVEASMAEQDAAQGDVGLWQLFRESFDEFVNNIVVPPRASYTVDDLGPAEFVFQPLSAGAPSVTVQRVDFTVRSARGLSLVASWWKPKPAPQSSASCAAPLTFASGIGLPASCRQ